MSVGRNNEGVPGRIPLHYSIISPLIKRTIKDISFACRDFVLYNLCETKIRDYLPLFVREIEFRDNCESSVNFVESFNVK